MIDFPDWVNIPKKQTQLQLARKRLRFLVLRAAVQATVAGNIVSFGEAIGLHRATMHNYIKTGSFSIVAAARAEIVFGVELIRKEWLTNPLDIDAK